MRNHLLWKSLPYFRALIYRRCIYLRDSISALPSSSSTTVLNGGGVEFAPRRPWQCPETTLTIITGGAAGFKWGRQSPTKTSVVPEILLHFQIPSSFLSSSKFGCLRNSTDTIIRPSLSFILPLWLKNMFHLAFLLMRAKISWLPLNASEHRGLHSAQSEGVYLSNTMVSLEAGKDTETSDSPTLRSS